MQQKLDSCLRLARQIKKKEDDIEELESRIMSAKNQIISDMPKGGGIGGNELESYLLKKERLEKIKSNLQALLNEKWKIIICEFDNCGIKDTEIRKMMWYRFYKGHEWKVCAKIMRKKYPEKIWNKNKCMRVYRYVLCKLHK